MKMVEENDQEMSTKQHPPAQPPALPVRIPRKYDENRVREGFWPKFKRIASKVPGSAEILALYFYLNSDVAPLQHKISIIATLAYFIMPFDLIPDFLPLGYTDDVAAALGLIKFIGSDVMRPYRVYARKWLRSEIGPEASLKDNLVS